jgi:hypothetical protein
MAQTFAAALIVACCLVYALWTLSPKALRRRLAAVLLKLPLPLLFQKPLQAAARQQGGCGCDGCDRSVSAKAPSVPGCDPAQGASGFKPMAFVPGNYAKKTPR